jgi:DNA primase
MTADRVPELRARLNNAAALVASLSLRTAPRATAKQAMICCPAHAERTPSCSVRLAKDGTLACRCHACGWTADALGLIGITEGLTEFPDVLKRAAELAGAPSLAEPIEVARKPRGEAEGVSDEDYHAAWTFVLDAVSPLAENAWHVAKYLHERAIFADAEAVDVRGLPKDTGPLVASLLATFERSKLEAAGIIRRGLDGIDWPGWCLLIPWRDRFGRITCLQRRRLDDERPKYRFPPERSPRAPFGVDLLAAALEYHGPSAEVVITEGALDCLARRRIARMEGARCAVLGVPSATQIEDLVWPVDLIRGRVVVLALDNDSPGESACNAVYAALKDVAHDFAREKPRGAKDWAAALAAGAL